MATVISTTCNRPGRDATHLSMVIQHQNAQRNAKARHRAQTKALRAKPGYIDFVAPKSKITVPKDLRFLRDGKYV